MPDLIIDDATPISGGHGLIPRDYSVHPVGYFCPPMEAVDMPVYPESEWVDRIREKDAQQSWLWNHIQTGMYGAPIPNNYQNGWRYCWAYSTGHALMAIRALMGLPHVQLSPFAVGYLIKGGRNEGGWGALSCEWAMANGYPTVEAAPNLKSPVRDSPELRASMAMHKVTEGWMDLQVQAYDRKLSRAQFVTALLNDCAVISDFNWWSHSVCSIALVVQPDGSIGTRIWNSHDPDGNDHGSTILTGSRAWPDGAVAVRAASPSNV